MHTQWQEEECYAKHNDEFPSQGIHIVHALIDGAVDAPDTLGKMLGKEKYDKLRQDKGLEKDG